MTPRGRRGREGWTRVRFGDIAEQINERVDDPNAAGVDRYVGLEHLDPGALRITRWGAPDEVTAQKLRFHPGDIIFGKRRAYQRKVAVAEFGGICSAHAMVLRERAGAIAPGFLIHFMASKSFMDRAIQISVGSLSPTINWSTLRDQEFDLPPVSEQLVVAAVLRCGGELSKSVGDALACSRQACLAFASQMFADNTDVVSFRELAEVQVGFPFPSSEYAETGVRLLRCSNVGVNKVGWGSDITKYWPPKRVHEVEGYLLQENDIVIALDRPFISEGFKIARLKAADVPSLLLQRVGRVQLRPGTNPGFLWAFLHSWRFQEELQRVQQGTHLPHISRFDIERTTMPRAAVMRQDAIAEQFARLQEAHERLQLRGVHTQDLLESVATRVGMGAKP